MDPVSHAVIGRALVAAVRPHDSSERGLAAAAVLGALSPDVDFLLMPVGWDVYLRAHAVGTHSLLGALVTGVGSGFIVRMVVRRTSLRTLMVAGVIGACSHLLADLAAGARVRPAWPIPGPIVSAPLVAMGDPWTVAILFVGAIAMWRARERLQSAARATLLVLTLFLALRRCGNGA